MFRFRLSTLMIVLSLAALAMLPIYRHFHEQPMALTPYSPVALQDRLSSKSPVVVVFHASWDLQSRRQLSSSSSMWSLIRDRSVLAMGVDCSTAGGSSEKLMRQMGVSKLPAFAVYSPDDPANPVVVSDLATEETVRAALSRVESSSRTNSIPARSGQ